MADPIGFSATTARFNLPFLHAAQTQKEFFVNEAHVVLDALLHPVAQGVASQPPQAPASGECWIVATGGQNAFEGYDEKIACYHEGQWLFSAPVPGMRVFNLATATFLHFTNGWDAIGAIDAPAGGSNVDGEARDAIANIIDALKRSGITA
ncbi:DUF2793 domain-containing protein [Croceicoccus sediminis]|uniref:DUF2793 domain-containing protein n=1 Tax=Croceicoccus sediminis TaxID=2571150 RepID=UPI001181CB39|nr:DUF2793 domain-containing protein [Croceicoccus sediminis]